MTKIGNIQVSMGGTAVWVHSFIADPNIGQFSKWFGIDVYNAVSAQTEEVNQCMDCTHGKAGHADQLEFG